MRKGLAAIFRKSFFSNECEREDSNLHGLCPLDPKSSASANSATLACSRKLFHQCNIRRVTGSSGVCVDAQHAVRDPPWIEYMAANPSFENAKAASPVADTLERILGLASEEELLRHISKLKALD